ncbi:RDD family protein [Campylobacter sp. MIT 99-7217]|uniref:RDD family protein n=1 Tax=Campylobacter sp. MIT 99-7217 TaxID=535091 RepID=UPI00115A7610|nr:RDD family protein [Campylobacter sp. MIT 99-7217]TQR31931.1 RDD family protein [Campylobacter sp. MIT 99-7217]
MDNDLLSRLDREGLKIASFTKRVLAYFIDNIILSFITIAILFNQIINAKDEFEVLLIVQNFLYGLILLQFAYHSIFTYLYGASIGKIICKIAILDENLLDKPSIAQSMIRSIVRQLSDMAFMLGFAWALSNDARKTWQDYVAKTVVIELA